MGCIVLSPTQIALLVVSKHFELHKTSSSTLKTSGMRPTLTELVVLRCLEYVYSIGKSEYQLYSSDQWNYLSVLAKELNVSPQKRIFLSSTNHLSIQVPIS